MNSNRCANAGRPIKLMSPTIEPTVTLGICTLGRVQSLVKLLKSYQAYRCAYDEVIVSDERYSAETEKTLKQILPSLKYIAGPARGLCANRNQILKNLKSEWVHFVDDDCEFANNFIAEFKKSNPATQKIYTGSEIKNGQKIEANNTNYLGFQTKPYRAGEVRKTVVINATLFPQQLFTQIQFDEQIRYGSDEVDIVFRATKLGFIVQPVDRFYVLHHHVDQFREGYHLQAEISRVYVGWKQHRSVIFLGIVSLHVFKTYLRQPINIFKILTGAISKIRTAKNQ